MNKLADKAKEAAEKGKEVAKDAVEEAQKKVDEAIDAANKAVEDAKNKANEVVDGIYDHLKDVSTILGILSPSMPLGCLMPSSLLPTSLVCSLKARLAPPLFVSACQWRMRFV